MSSRYIQKDRVFLNCPFFEEARLPLTPLPLLLGEPSTPRFPILYVPLLFPNSGETSCRRKARGHRGRQRSLPVHQRRARVRQGRECGTRDEARGKERKGRGARPEFGASDDAPRAFGRRIGAPGREECGAECEAGVREQGQGGGAGDQNVSVSLDLIAFGTMGVSQRFHNV